MRTIHSTVKFNLCISCGVCKEMCPKKCIYWSKNKGMYLPKIAEKSCISCGLCAAVCPGLGHHYEQGTTAKETVVGSVIECFNAWSTNSQLRHVSASGGVISTIIRELLQRSKYDGAFCLESYDYHNQLMTRLCTAEDFERPEDTNIPKSRYLPVSHEKALAYMKENRTSKLILVGTPCAFRALQKAITKLNLKRENYLFIGLICDRVFNYNVIHYFEDAYASGNQIKALHFKNKESGGWPGDMKIFPVQGEPFYIPLAERGKAKDYFAVERCIYCVDKLNSCADISVGDNYTEKNTTSLGSNSVIIRTRQGKEAWEIAQNHIESAVISIEEVQKAQDISWRLNNLCYGDLKAERMKLEANLNIGVQREQYALDYEQTWREILKKLQCGSCYDTHPEKLYKLRKKESKKSNRIVLFLKRVYYYLRRKIKRGYYEKNNVGLRHKT